MKGDVLASNRNVLNLVSGLGFVISQNEEDTSFKRVVKNFQALSPAMRRQWLGRLPIAGYDVKSVAQSVFPRQGDLMKTWFIVLPLLCLTSLTSVADPAEPAAAPNETQAKKQMTAQDRARPYQRDMRHCLDKKTNREIHRCTVKQRKR